MTNNQVADRFWEQHPKDGHSRSMFYEDGKLFSYGTCILQRVNGYVIGNGTRYSQTTSGHQSSASIYKADLVLHEVSRGVTDLKSYAVSLFNRLSKILYNQEV